MTTNEFLRQNLAKIPHFLGNHITCRVRPAMQLADGTKLSVQASSQHYCTPRKNDVSEYSAVEIAYSSQVIPELLEYAEDPKDPTNCRYPYVPVEVLDKVIEARGGIV